VLDKSGIVVAHAAINDEQMLDGIDFTNYVVRDTQSFYWRQFNRWVGRALADLSAAILGRGIQTTEHSSVEDARATMDLFLYYRKHSQHEAGRGYDGKLLAKDVPVDYVGTSGGASTSDSDSGTPTSDIVPLKNVVSINTTSSGAATTLDSSSPNSNASPRGSVSTNTSASSGGRFAPGHLLALPDIKEFTRGRIFDRKTSTYLRRRCCGSKHKHKRGTTDGASTKFCRFLI
jgi:hypothetical protein